MVRDWAAFSKLGQRKPLQPAFGTYRKPGSAQPAMLFVHRSEGVI
jgi:hypothetical protein